MSDFWAVRHGDNLRIADVESAVAFSRLPIGKALHIEVRQPRNGAHHRLYWALCHRIANAIGSTSENVSDLLKIATGHCNIVKSKTYGEVRLPKSISFAAMDQSDFREFFERCIVVICTEWGMERADVLAAVEDLLVPQEIR